MIIVLLLSASIAFCNAALPAFVADTAEHLQLIKTAFEDGITLARTVAIAWMANCDPYLDHYYDRYFAPEDAEFVQNIFGTIAAVPLDFDFLRATPDDIRNFMNSLTPELLNDKFSGLSISYGNHPLKGPGPGCDLPYLNGILDIHPHDQTHAKMSLCPRLFEKYYSLRDTSRPPAALIQQGIPGLGCDVVGNTESDYMWTPGTTVLHELLHWSHLFEEVPDWSVNIRGHPIIDGRSWIDDYRPTIRPDITANNPRNGYTGFNAQLVRNLPDDEEEGYIEAVNNADNYACCASARAWGLICNRNFAPPAEEEDWWKRADPEDSDSEGSPEPTTAAKLAARQGDPKATDGPVGCTVDSRSEWLTCY